MRRLALLAARGGAQRLQGAMPRHTPAVVLATSPGPVHSLTHTVSRAMAARSWPTARALSDKAYPIGRRGGYLDNRSTRQNQGQKTAAQQLVTRPRHDTQEPQNYPGGESVTPPPSRQGSRIDRNANDNASPNTKPRASEEELATNAIAMMQQTLSARHSQKKVVNMRSAKDNRSPPHEPEGGGTGRGNMRKSGWATKP